VPTYDYICEACDHRFEKFQSMKARSLRKCPSCGKPKLRRLIGSGAAVIFKGSGFYQTDYRDASYKKDSKSDSASIPAPAPAAKTDAAKPAPPKPESPAPSAEKKDSGSKKDSGKKDAQ
jgi:putative FmdB family regulatory protein